MKKLTLGAVALSSIITSAHGAQTGLSLGQLKQKCKEYASNSQILPFTSSFTCHYTKTFWVETDKRTFVLPREREISYQALVKDGKHQGDTVNVNLGKDPQYGQCVDVEQYRMSLSRDYTLTTCAELESIASEEEYCSRQLASEIAQCTSDVNDAKKAGPFAAPKGLCHMEKTGQKKECQGQPQTPTRAPEPAPAPAPTTSSSSSSSSESSTSSESSSSYTSMSSGEVRDMVHSMTQGSMLKANDMGASMTVVKAGRVIKHKVVEITSDVAPGSVLAKMGLRKGDQIKHVDNQRVESVEAFIRLVSFAQKKGKALVDVCRNGTHDFTTQVLKLS